MRRCWLLRPTASALGWVTGARSSLVRNDSHHVRNGKQELDSNSRFIEAHKGSEKTGVAAEAAFGRPCEWLVAVGTSGRLKPSRLPPPPRATHPREARRQPHLCVSRRLC